MKRHAGQRAHAGRRARITGLLQDGTLWMTFRQLHEEMLSLGLRQREERALVVEPHRLTLRQYHVFYQLVVAQSSIEFFDRL